MRRTFLREKQKGKNQIEEKQNHQPITSLNSHQVLQISQEIEENQILSSTPSSAKNINTKNTFKNYQDDKNNQDIIIKKKLNQLDLDPLTSTEIYTTISIETEPAPEVKLYMENFSS